MMSSASETELGVANKGERKKGFLDANRMSHSLSVLLKRSRNECKFQWRRICTHGGGRGMRRV